MCLFPPFFILYYVLTKLILFLYTVRGSVRWLVRLFRLFLVLNPFSLNAPSLGMRVCVFLGLLTQNSVGIRCRTGATRTTSIIVGAGTDPIQQGTLTLTLTIPIGGCLL